MIISKFPIVIFITTTIVFLMSLLISPYYLEGDQVFYIKVYNTIQDFSFFEGFSYYKSSLSSNEFFHFLLVWIFSFLGINKILFVSVSNTVLAYVTMSLLKKWKVSIIVSIPLVLTNFYFLTLYFSAERLKFAIIFLMLSLLYADKRKKFIIYSSAAIMSHAQMIILYASLIFNFIIENTLRIIKTTKMSKFIFYLFPIISILLYIMAPQVVYKISSYHNAYGLENFSKTIIFFALALWYSKNKQETIVLFIPLFISIYFVGDFRINMFAYFIFLYYGVQINRGYNLGILLTTIYYGYKSIFFVMSILKYGDGFYIDSLPSQFL